MLNILKNLSNKAAFIGGFFVAVMLMGAWQIHTATAYQKNIAQLELAHANARVTALVQSIAAQARLKFQVSQLKDRLADVASKADVAALAQVAQVKSKYTHLNTELQNEITRLLTVTANSDGCDDALSDKLRKQINAIASPYLSSGEPRGDAGGDASPSPEPSDTTPTAKSD